MRLLLVSFLAASAAAFSINGPEKQSKTALHYYRAHSRFDVPEQGPIQVEKQGPAVLQGGAEIDWALGPEIPTSEADADSAHLPPQFDVSQQGSILVEKSGVAALQGGAEIDYFLGPPIPDGEQSSYYMEPKFDIPAQGSIMMDKHGVTQVQGGAVVDWQQQWQ
ncbi:expressed unknown protein [Seminavis robusta]|uniref:Uncharacterized protein n=1 Tax=Seminavis robusta TaxID=568900 RepID=A0A9N8H9A5_9STRA|nr:expressed unknown protein [Seminavis robusta]|eukprot:Sro199_g084280.1 n/a (164) ;mRNA; f:21740-22231